MGAEDDVRPTCFISQNCRECRQPNREIRCPFLAAHAIQFLGDLWVEPARNVSFAWLDSDNGLGPAKRKRERLRVVGEMLFPPGNCLLDRRLPRMQFPPLPSRIVGVL